MGFAASVLSGEKDMPTCFLEDVASDRLSLSESSRVTRARARGPSNGPVTAARERGEILGCRMCQVVGADEHRVGSFCQLGVLPVFGEDDAALIVSTAAEQLAGMAVRPGASRVTRGPHVHRWGAWLVEL